MAAQDAGLPDAPRARHEYDADDAREDPGRLQGARPLSPQDPDRDGDDHRCRSDGRDDAHRANRKRSIEARQPDGGGESREGRVHHELRARRRPSSHGDDRGRKEQARAL